MFEIRYRKLKHGYFKVCHWCISRYGCVDDFKVLDLVLEVTDYSLLRAYRLQQLKLLLLNQVPISLNVFESLLKDGELLLLIGYLFLFDLILLLVLLEQLDLFFFLDEFLLELEDRLLVLQLHFIDFSVTFLSQFLS